MSPAVDFGSAVTVVRLGRFSTRYRHRTVLVGALTTAAALAVALLSLATGDLALSLPEVLGTMFGVDDEFTRMVVLEWRAPRVVAALVFGAALGVAGAVFQSLTRNPLASPDLIGISAGSYTGVLVVVTILGGSSAQIATGSLLGGVATAALVYLLAYRRGIQGFRLIIVGIGIAAMLASLNTFLILRSRLELVMDAAIWGAGTLNAASWDQVLPGAVVAVVLFLALGVLAPGMRQLELGDDAARALGTRVEVTRLLLILGGVALTATVTAVAGPIAFVALAAPQIARRLSRTPGVAMGPSAVMGALLLVGADFLGQHALPAALPVGIVTVVLGGIYLVWLLVHEARRNT